MKKIKKNNAYFWVLILLFVFNLISFYPTSIAKTNSQSNATDKFRIETKPEYIYFTNHNVFPSDNYINGKIYSDASIIAFELCNLKNTTEMNALPYVTKENGTNIYDFKIPISKIQLTPNLYNNIYDMAIFCDNNKNKHIEKRFRLYIYNNLESFIAPFSKTTYLIYYQNPNIVKLDKNNVILHNKITIFNNCYISDIFHSLSSPYPTATCLPAQYKILLKKANIWSSHFSFYINVKALLDLNFLKEYTNGINNISIVFPDNVEINVNKTTGKITLLYKNYKENIPQNNIITNSDGTFINVKLLNNISNKKILILNDDATPLPITITIIIIFMIAVLVVSLIINF